MWFKACPKCKTGDLFPQEDTYGSYIQCAQCGTIMELKNPPVLSKKTPKSTYDNFYVGNGPIIDLYDNGNSVVEIAQMLNLDVKTVCGVVGYLAKIRRSQIRAGRD